MEEKAHIIVSRIGDNGVGYEVKQENEVDSKIRVLWEYMIMKTDNMLHNFDSIVSISEKEKVKQKSKSPNISKRKIMQRTDNNQGTAGSDKEHPLQLGSWRKSTKQAGSNSESGKRKYERDSLKIQKKGIESKEKKFKDYDLR